MAADMKMCSICQHGVLSGEDQRAMLCGCLFHMECLETYIDTVQTTLVDCACPNCRWTADNAASAEANMVHTIVDESQAEAADTAETSAVAPIPGTSAGEQPPETSADEATPAASEDAPIAIVSAVPARPKGRRVLQRVRPAPSPPGSPQSVGSVASTAASITSARVAPQLSGNAIGISAPRFPKSEYRCSLCAGPLLNLKCRLVNKTAKKWKCSVCACKITQLHDVFGTWPTAEFKRMSDEEQAKFFKDCGAVRKRDDLAEFAKTVFETFTVEAKVYYDGGEFLPLTVWETRGFDSRLIEAASDPSDIMEHPVLGITYRVSIVSTGLKGETGTRSSSVAEAEHYRSHVPVQDVFPAATAKKRSRNSSSSSSSSNNKKRKREKKGRKALKKAKDQEKALKLKAKADDASKKKRKILAAKFLSKLEPALLALESNLCSGSSESLSPLVKSSAADILTKMKKARLDVKATIDDPSTELAYESEYINQLVSNAKKANAVVTSALASVARFNL